MDFDNPDNRKYVMVALGVFILMLWLIALWLDSEKLGYTGGLLLMPFIGTAIWTTVGYDNESYQEAANRKAAKRKSARRLDNDV